MAQVRIRMAAWIVTTAFTCTIQGKALGDVLPWQDGPQPHGSNGTALVNHQPSNVGGFGADTLFADFPGSEQCADDFSIPLPVHRIVWWGFHNLNIQPVANETFRIRVYDERPNDLLPGMIIYEQTFANVPRTWTGRFILDSGAPREFLYQVDLPIELTLNSSRHWLEIAQVGDINSLFRWEASNFPPLNGQAVNNPIAGDWFAPQSVVSNTAFQLINLPEPNSTVLVAIAGIALLCRRSRHWS